MSPHSPEATHTLEALTSELVDGMVAGAANHEMKLLTLIAMGSKPVYHSIAGLNQLTTSIQGRSPAWEQSIRIPAQYCSSSLVPIGAVEEGTKPSALHPAKQAVAYKITPFGQEIGVPFSGLLLKWSEDHPEISLQQLLGGTKTRSDKGFRAPQVRLGIYYDLLTRPDGTTSITDIGGFGLDSHLVMGSVQDLEDLGIVKVDRITDLQKRQVELEPVDRTHHSWVAETQAIYEAKLRLEQEGKLEISADEFINKVTETSPDLEPYKIRTKLMEIFKYDFRTGIVSVRDGKFSEGKLTAIYLNPDYEQPIAELIAIIDGLKDPSQRQGLLRLGREYAQQIINDPQRVYNLAAKAREASSYADKLTPAQWEHVLKHYITEEGITVKALREILASRGLSVSSDSVNRQLALLEAKGKIKTDLVQTNPKTKRLSKVAALALKS